jgi:hypothetical protein
MGALHKPLQDAMFSKAATPPRGLSIINEQSLLRVSRARQAP